MLIPVWNRQALTHFIQCPCLNCRLGLPIDTLYRQRDFFAFERNTTVCQGCQRDCSLVSRPRTVAMSSQTSVESDSSRKALTWMPMSQTGTVHNTTSPANKESPKVLRVSTAASTWLGGLDRRSKCIWKWWVPLQLLIPQRLLSG